MFIRTGVIISMTDSAALPDKPYELVFNDVHGMGKMGVAGLWIAEVEKRTGGRVHFRRRYSADAGKTEGADVVRDVPAGGGRYHLLDLIQTPFIFPAAVSGSRAVAQLYAEFPEFRDEMSEVKVVGLGIGAMMAIFSSKRWGPIRTMEDCRGARMRSLLPIDPFIAALGAEPLHIDFLEIGPMLEKGELDATVIGLLPARGFKFPEKGVPYCTIVGGLSVSMHPIRLYMKHRSWEMLPDDIREIIEGIGPAGEGCWFAAANGASNDTMVSETLDYIRESGGEVIVPAADELERWVKLAAPLREESIGKAEAAGQPGKRFFERMLALVEEYSG